MKFILSASICFLTMKLVSAQTLFAPSGAVGTSTNSNVGIGLNSPESNLHVRGDDLSFWISRATYIASGSEIGIDFRQLTHNGAFRTGGAIKSISSNSYTGGNGSTYDSHLVLYSSGNGNLIEGLRINDIGSIGIGTSTVRNGYKMEVAGKLVTSDGLDNGQISFRNDRDDSRIYESGYVLNMTSANGLSLDYDANQNNNGFFDINEYGVSRLRIDDSGKVGIGTTSPDYIFEVETSTSINNTEYLLGAFNHVGNGGGVYLGYVGDGTSAKQGRVRSGGNVDLAIGTTSFREAINVINSNGYVGIGTNSPQSKLAVNGQIRATEVKVLADISVPDYVFEPDYELRTLKETQEYIEENKHLPEIPSASEISENGIDLGDMNMRLLKKIEELTLYIIEQNERLEKAEEMIVELQKD